MADSASLTGSVTQITLSEESMEEGIEWNSALTAAVTMATEEGMKKDTDEISGKLRLLLGSFFSPFLTCYIPETEMCKIRRV